MKDAGSADRQRVFFIGLNKCGTTSIHTLFERSGYRSVHWRTRDGRFVAKGITTNIALGRKPFDQMDEYDAYSELSFFNNELIIEGAIYFREIEKSYPDSYFVLNTRNVENWIVSRSAHHGMGGLMIERAMRASCLPRDQLIENWRELHRTHHEQVRAHFRDHPRFLEFDIEKDSPERLKAFLEPHFSLETAHWGRRNSTRAKARAKA